MKPADLLADLETGDRTMEHMQDKPEPEPQGQNISLGGINYHIAANLRAFDPAAWGTVTYTTANAQANTLSQLQGQASQYAGLQAQSGSAQAAQASSYRDLSSMIKSITGY